MSDVKIPLLLFSGGLDSTFLLHNTLKKEPVDVFYVKGVVHEEKQEAELIARKKIIDHLNKQHRRGDWQYGEFVTDLEHPFYNREHNAQTYGQALPWFFAALDHYDPTRHSRVIIGYIESDGIVQHIPDMKLAWDALTRATKHDHVPLEFPISYKSKEWIYSTLEQENPALLKMIWNCELPTKKNNRFYECKTCASCETKIGYMAIIEARKKRAAAITKQVKLKTAYQ